MHCLSLENFLVSGIESRWWASGFKVDSAVKVKSGSSLAFLRVRMIFKSASRYSFLVFHLRY
jgi:hypothetical protein